MAYMQMSVEFIWVSRVGDMVACDEITALLLCTTSKEFCMCASSKLASGLRFIR